MFIKNSKYYFVKQLIFFLLLTPVVSFKHILLRNLFKKTIIYFNKKKNNLIIVNIQQTFIINFFYCFNYKSDKHINIIFIIGFDIYNKYISFKLLALIIATTTVCF